MLSPIRFGSTQIKTQTLPSLDKANDVTFTIDPLKPGGIGTVRLESNGFQMNLTEQLSSDNTYFTQPFTQLGTLESDLQHYRRTPVSDTQAKNWLKRAKTLLLQFLATPIRTVPESYTKALQSLLRSPHLEGQIIQNQTGYAIKLTNTISSSDDSVVFSTA